MVVNRCGKNIGYTFWVHEHLKEKDASDFYWFFQTKFEQHFYLCKFLFILLPVMGSGKLSWRYETSVEEKGTLGYSGILKLVWFLSC